MNPAPTPYDITDIPLFPYVPGFWEWCALGVLALIIYKFISTIARRKTSVLEIDAYSLARRDLEAILRQPEKPVLSKQECFRVALLLRRFLDTALPFEASSQTALEFESAIQEMDSSELNSMARILKRLESAKYAPGDSGLPEREMIRAALDALGELHRHQATGAKS